MLRRVLFLFIIVFFVITLQAYADSSSHRRGAELDNWREEGSSAITDSPVYAKGVRLSAWSYGEGDGYQFAIAHVEYLFSVPTWAHSVDITVAYSGNDGKWGSGPAGRLWIKRRSSVEGDSFELPETMRSQSVRLATRDYDNNGWMTLRVVVEGSQEIDVNYVNVRFYTSAYQLRVVTRYYAKYVWRPWYRYTYWHFYPGRHLHWDPYLGRWVVYSYPRYPYYWPVIRSRYNAYIHGYYNGLRDGSGSYRWQVRDGGRSHIGKWSSSHALARYGYRTSGSRPTKRLRKTLAEHKQRRRSVTGMTRASQKTTLERVRQRQAKTRASTPKQRREVVGRSSSGFTDRLRQAPRSEGKEVRLGTAADLRRFRETSRRDVKREVSRSSVKTRPNSSVRARVRSGASLRGSQGSIPPRKVRRERERVVERREVVRTERQSTSSRVKQRRAVERAAKKSVGRAPARSSSDDEEKEKQRAAARRSASSARKRRR